MRACSHSPEQWRPLKSPGGAAGSYLRQIAAVHDWKQIGADVAHLQLDLQATLTACAQQLVLPEAKVSSSRGVCIFTAPAACL